MKKNKVIIVMTLMKMIKAKIIMKTITRAQIMEQKK